MIRYVQVFGERCSGTNYLASLVRKNFGGVELTKDFGGKHWFIKDHLPRSRPNRSTDHQCVRPLGDGHDTLFLVIYRNPFDWLRSLHEKPHHAEGHRGLPFSEFIRKRWVSYETKRMNRHWPESDRGDYFIEEAENVLRLRTLKVRHLNALRDVVENVAFINYEELALDVGMLADIAERFGIRLAQSPPVDDPFYFGSGRLPTFSAPRIYPPIPARDLQFIRENLDWNVERRIGYPWEECWRAASQRDPGRSPSAKESVTPWKLHRS